MCKMGACWTVATQSICLPIFTTQIVCLLIFYHSFLHACWCCVSLFAIPACMVSHYQPCLLVWSLTIGHAFWCDASLSAMPLVCCLTIGNASGVVPHYQPCPLVWCLTIGHVCWSVATATDIFTRRMATNMVLLVQRCHHIRHVC